MVYASLVDPSGVSDERDHFGSRRTRLTRRLRQGDVDRALREAATEIRGWGGGTNGLRLPSREDCAILAAINHRTLEFWRRDRRIPGIMGYTFHPQL